MNIIKHRVNTVADLVSTPRAYGIETDIRPYGNRLVLHHEPFEDGDDFEEFIRNYKHGTFIANVKSEGIERKVIDTIEKAGISDYFLLDVTFPYMVKYINKGFKKLATRFSEYEDIQTSLNLAGKVDWAFIDNLTHLPVENNAFERLAEHFKICIVSPELLKRDEIPATKELLKLHPAHAVLTDDIEAWK
jgi:hypothetical protein